MNLACSQLRGIIVCSVQHDSLVHYDAYYVKAQKARTVIRDEFNRVFNDFDVVVSPTTPTPAFAFGSQADPMKMYLNDLATIPANMAGLPAMSLPCGAVNGMPVGVQLVGKALDEETLFRAGAVFQKETQYHQARPGVLV